MSDEPTPQPLRLKPRARLETESSPPAPIESVSPVAESSASTSEPPKLRLRPKLEPVPTAESAAAPVAEAPVVTPPPRTISLKPRLAAEAATASTPEVIGGQEAVADSAPSTPAPAVELPKFKLKEKSPAPSAEVGTTVAAPAPFAPPPPPPPPSIVRPVVPSAVVAPSASLPPPIPSTATASGTTPPLPKPVSKPSVPRLVTEAAGQAPAQGSSVRKVITVAIAFIVLIGAWFIYRKLVAPPAPTPVAEAPKRPSTPSATLNELSTVPARAIEKAKATIATANESEKERVETVTSNEEPPARPASKVESKPVPATTATTQLSPGITATTTAKDVAGDASPEFKNWVAQARVSGVFQGSPARALINGRTVSAGQIVDEKLEITFEGIDSSAKNLVFRDRTGASVVRKF